MQLHLNNPMALWGILVVLGVFITLYIFQRKSTPLSITKYFFMTIAFCLCFLALARPQWGQEQLSENPSQPNLVIAIDVSQSMLAEDISPSRLLFSTTFALKLANNMPGSRIALFPFASNGFLQVPLTQDHRVLAQMLPTLNPQVTSQKGSDINQSLETLILRLQNMKRIAEENGEKWLPTRVIFFSDGESHFPIDPTIVSRFKENNIPIYSVGVATEQGSRIPKPKGYFNRIDYLRDSSGGIVTTKLDKKNLKLLSGSTGGEVFSASLDQVQPLVSALKETLVSGAVTSNLKVEKEYYPLLLGLALLIFIGLFSKQRWEYSIRSLLVFLLLSNQLMANSEEQALNEIQNTKDANKRAMLLYNLASQYEANGKPKKAIEAYQEGAFLTDAPEIKKKSLFNMGNLQLKSGDPTAAIEAYQEAYSVNSKEADFQKEANQRISENMVLAMKVQKQMKQQGKSKKQGGDGKGKGSEPKDPKGPKHKYEQEQFSQLRKKRLFDLIASEEQKAMQKLNRKKLNQRPTTYRGKPW